MLRFTAVGGDEMTSGFLFIVPKDEGCSKPQLQVRTSRYTTVYAR